MNAPGRTLPKPKKRISQDDLKAAVANAGLAMTSQPTVPSASGALQDATLHSTIRLNLDQVDPYENNPRTWQNEKFADIKASIRARGLDSMMSVTRRPGSKRYVLAKGGGTRYRALRELWEETQDRKFYEIDFGYSEYRGEVDILAAHISENLNRDDMVFWDKAKSFVGLRYQIEEESGDLTFKDLVARFKELGLPDIGKSSLALYQFTFDALHPLGAVAYHMTGLTVRDSIQPAYNLHKRLLQKSPRTEISFDEEIWHPALQGFAAKDEGHPDWSELIADVTANLAQCLGLEMPVVLGMLEALRLGQKSQGDGITWDQLLPPPPPPPSETKNQGALPPANKAGQQSPQSADSGVRVRQAPTTFQAPGSGQNGSEDEDRPPPEIVVQVEAEQRQRAQERQADTPRGAGTEPPPAPPMPRLSPGDAVGHAKLALHTLAERLAANSKTLDGTVIRHDAFPMGWLVDVPQSVLDGQALPPLARQIFWFLARLSFQLNISLPLERIADTRFGKFIESGALWELVKPDEGDGFLFDWMLDPGHIALSGHATRMLVLTRELIADFPGEFQELSLVMHFDELQESAQEARQRAEQEALDYYLEHGATPAMMRHLFPAAEQSVMRFRSGRVPEIDLKTAQRLYNVWDALRQSVASERERYIRLHQEFPAYSIASLYAAINEG